MFPGNECQGESKDYRDIAQRGQGCPVSPARGDNVVSWWTKVDTMYRKHFGLDRLPFANPLDEDFFYPGSSHLGLLDAMEQAILDGEGVIKVIGKVGTGKTTLCRLLCQRMPERVHTALILDARIAPGELCNALLEEFQQCPTSVHDAHGSRRQLQDYLIQLYAAREQAVLMVDEAQSMAPETYRELLFLSNVGTGYHPILQMVFFGRPELDQVLAEPSLRPLHDRVTRSLTVPFLSLEETGNFIQARLNRASDKGIGELFTPGAVAKIHQMACGSLRRVNVLAHDAMVYAFQAGVARVEKRHVRLCQPGRNGIVFRLHRLFAGMLDSRGFRGSLSRVPVAVFVTAGLMLVLGTLSLRWGVPFVKERVAKTKAVSPVPMKVKVGYVPTRALPGTLDLEAQMNKVVDGSLSTVGNVDVPIFSLVSQRVPRLPKREIVQKRVPQTGFPAMGALQPGRDETKAAHLTAKVIN